LSYRCRQQTRPSTTTTSVVDNAIIDLPWRNDLSPEFGTKFQMDVPYFWRYPNFLITHETGEGCLHAKTQLHSSSRFDALPACCRRTNVLVFTALSQRRAVKTKTYKTMSHRLQKCRECAQLRRSLISEPVDGYAMESVTRDSVKLDLRLPSHPTGIATLPVLISHLSHPADVGD